MLNVYTKAPTSLVAFVGLVLVVPHLLNFHRFAILVSRVVVAELQGLYISRPARVQFFFYVSPLSYKIIPPMKSSIITSDTDNDKDGDNNK